MTVKQAINAVKIMLGADVPTEEVTVEVQMAEAVLVDDTVVYTDGELTEGAVLKVKTEEDEDPSAPIGKHETKDGLIVTVAEGGIIESIEEKGEEPVSEEAEEEIKVEEKMEEDKEEDLEIEVKEEKKDFVNKIFFFYMGRIGHKSLISPRSLRLITLKQVSLTLSNISSKFCPSVLIVTQFSSLNFL